LLGGTARYRLLYYGLIYVVGASGVVDPLSFVYRWTPHLVGGGVAFLIGVRFRSWWWVLGPLMATALPIAAVIVIDILQSFFFSEEPLTEPQIEGAEIALGMIVASLMLFAGVYSLVAAAGVGSGSGGASGGSNCPAAQDGCFCWPQRR
jgi:hypothetical protein